MNLLLDTHVLLWFLDDAPQLVPTAKALIEDGANRKLVSVATCWEVAIKTGLKKLDLGEPAATFLSRELAANGFDLLRIELAHVTFVETLPPHHKDPFDRLLVAQALIELLPLVSADAILDQYGVTRLWK
ncbi:MAG: type II toxin-antitoxin system VapC family toxin [Gemmataceae bacterium]|nr:type II toxin-antitoxin system VapC family toxin [Gemmataceae bacterium]